MRKAMWGTILILTLTGTTGFAQQAKKIQDNSFLLEEAYNQEPKVVQHIQGFQYMRDNTWAYAFTQEWPMGGQRSQLSYTIPIVRLGDGAGETGVGDVALNYRYQLILKGPVALAPRFSLLFPTGDSEKSLGSGALGLQTNIPLSVELSDKVVTHWNTGFTFTPNTKGTDGSKADTLGYNLGASAIYLLGHNFNLMLEAAYFSTESVRAFGFKERENTFLINPGARLAINFKSGLQIVPGIAVPIGVGPSQGQRGVFFYLSFEHPF